MANFAFSSPPRRLGMLRGTVLYMAPDFDAPLEDFEELHGMRLLLDPHAVVRTVADPSRKKENV